MLKEGFFDFIFEAEEFMTPDSHKKRLQLERIFRDNMTETIEKDESNKPEDVNYTIDDVEHLCNMFDGNICFKYCSERKINSISDITDVLLDKELGDELKKSNPSNFKYIHEKRKLVQEPNVGKGFWSQ